MSQTRYIKADHLQLVLAVLRMRRLNPDIHPFCALSNGATWMRCDRRYRSDSDTANRWTHQPLCLPMIPSVTTRLVDRVKTGYGLREVKATWGTGYKVLLAEISTRKAAQ
jgi:hypothetical protein